MPSEYRWDEPLRIIRTRFWGHVTNEDLIMQAMAVYGNPRLGPPLGELVDLSEVKSTEVTINALRKVVQIDIGHSERFEGLSTAIVAPTDELRSMAQAFATLSEVYDSPTSVRIFGTHDQAEQWLAALRKAKGPPG